jgi:hypothetical protein
MAYNSSYRRVLVLHADDSLAGAGYLDAGGRSEQGFMFVVQVGPVLV